MSLFLKCFRGIHFKVEASVRTSLMLAVSLSTSSCLPVQRGRIASPTSKASPASNGSPEPKALPIQSKPALKVKIQLPETLPARVKAWRSIVDAAIKESGSDLFGAGDCVAYTGAWIQRMSSQMDIVLSLGESNGVGVVKLKDGSDVKQHITHTFAVDRGLCKTSGYCAEEIIIDASYLQFLVGGECRVDSTLEGCADKTLLSKLPPVLIGSPSQVSQFYSKLVVKIKLPDIIDARTRQNWLPHTAASLIYSLGINAKLRQTIDGKIE